VLTRIKISSFKIFPIETTNLLHVGYVGSPTVKAFLLAPIFTAGGN
jgi:hypothetical protein